MSFVFKVNNNGDVLDLVKGENFSFAPGDNLMDHISGLDKIDVNSFLNKIYENGDIGPYLGHFSIDGKVEDYYLSGIRVHDDLFLVGAAEKKECLKIFNDIRKFKEREIYYSRQKVQKIVEEGGTFFQSNEGDELKDIIQVNNELVNLQRELVKNHHLLKEKSAQQEELLSQLDNKNQQLSDKNKELEQFAYLVSHDLKSPLARIISLADLLEADYGKKLGEEGATLIQYIKDVSNKMDNIIMAILSYARVVNTEVVVSTFSIKELFEELAKELIKPEAFIINFPGEDWQLTGSYIQLNQVLTNLVSNAIKYHNKNDGKVDIGVSDLNDFIQVSVTDDGPGIPNEFREKVFHLFQSANKEKREDSTGVGLAIAKKIVEQNGGKIGLNSKEGAGSTFWFTWPKSFKNTEKMSIKE